MTQHGMETNRTRTEAIRDSRLHGEDSPVAVAGQWIDLVSGRPAFKVGVGFSIATVPNRLAYRGSVIPQRRLLAFEDSLYDEFDEGPSCSLCDGLGHGYPGGGPCPLEDRGWQDAWQDEVRF
jgi:hypothetical protein